MVNILVLNYARPRETELCLKSIKQNCLFNHRVYVLNNGGHDHDKFKSLLDQKLIDVLIESPNQGGGFGTIELFLASDSKYSLWIECDCEIGAILSQELIDQWTFALDYNYQNLKCIDLTGGICGQNIYSGRSFFINTELYRSIKKDEGGLYGGPGPYNHIKYLEQFIQEYFKENNYNVAHIPVIKDNGYSSVRENPDGSQYIHQPDRKGLKVLKYPTEKYIYPKWSENEWREVLETKNWEDWKIPEDELKDSFHVWN